MGLFLADGGRDGDTSPLSPELLRTLAQVARALQGAGAGWTRGQCLLQGEGLTQSFLC